MIVVRVELHSAITGQVSELARMNIANIGGTQTKGDYHCETREVRVLEFDQTGLAIVQKLISLDELELTVVEDDPDDGNVVLDGRHQLETRQIVASITATHDDSAVRMG